MEPIGEEKGHKAMKDVKPRMHMFRDRADRQTHIVFVFGSKRPRRDRFARFVCGVKVGDAIRMAPHSDRSREPEITCDVCVDAVTAINDIMEGVAWNRT